MKATGGRALSDKAQAPFPQQRPIMTHVFGVIDAQYEKQA
jgi:hypothetical protein